MPEYVPWHFTDDKVLVCLVGGDPPSKKLCTLADVMCHVTKERGITEAKLVDHVMRPKVKARPTLNHLNYWNSKLQYAKRNCGIVGQSALVSFSTLKQTLKGGCWWGTGLPLSCDSKRQHPLLQTKRTCEWRGQDQLSEHSARRRMAWPLQRSSAHQPLRRCVGGWI